MSLYQCQQCGCRENTALGMPYGMPPKYYSWAGIEDRKGKHLCSVCMPTHFSDGEQVDRAGEWHNQFPRMFLPMGQFKTNGEGNLEHIATGRTDIRSFAISTTEKPA